MYYKKPRFRKHFRRGKEANNGHPTYIFAKQGDKFKFIGITHSAVVKGVDTIKLDKNPNPVDKQQSYILPTPQIEVQKKFGRKLPNWSFADSDKGSIKSVIKKDQPKKK